MHDNRCEGGCSRHWTYEWLQAETGRRWLLYDVHSSRSVEKLTALGFDAFAKPVEEEVPA